MSPTPTTYGEMMFLEDHGPDTYVGVSPAYMWGRIYGGQVIAQGLWAAFQTVDERFVPHSVHAYFIRAARSTNQSATRSTGCATAARSARGRW